MMASGLCAPRYTSWMGPPINWFIFVLIIISWQEGVNCDKSPNSSTPTNSQVTTNSHENSPSNLAQPEVWDTKSLYGASYVNNPHHYHRSTQITRPTRTRRSTSNEQSASPSKAVSKQQTTASNYVDACPSKMEIITPYYATNSKGKLRNVVNSELMQQAIQIETCMRPTNNQAGGKCNLQADCGCEQKYKWHRLLVTNPRDLESAHSLFTDWFLFPSNCVCRCRNASITGTKQFIKLITKKT